MTRSAKCPVLIALWLGPCLLSLPACNEATVSLFPAPTSASAPSVQPDAGLGPVSVWALAGDATDPVGGNQGVIIGNVTFEDDPVRGQVLVCNGVDTAISVTNVTTLDFTYAAWIWTNTPSSKGDTAIQGDALFWSNCTPCLDDFTLALLNDRLSYISYSLKSTGNRSLIDGSWHHVVVTRREAERVALYVDGQVDGDGDSGSGPVLGNEAVYLCGNPEEGGYFTGKMADARFYARVLSAEEVQSLYAATLR